MKTKLTVLICCGLAAGLIAACGGGGDDNDTGGGGDSAAPLTKAEFDQKANEICTQGQQKVADLQKEVQAKIQSDPTQVKNALEDTIKQLIPVIRNTLNQIGELNPPAELQSQLDEFVQKGNTAVDQLESDPSKISSGDNPFSELKPLAEQLGLQNCGAATG